jgi:hypothetical protein
MDRSTLYEQFSSQMEDFWRRKASAPEFQREFRVYGRLVQLRSNQEALLTVADQALPLYSRAQENDLPPCTIQLIVQPARVSPGPAPEELIQRILYTGDGDALMLHLGGWGHAHVDLGRSMATVVMVPELARRPDLLTQSAIHTILLNFCIAGGCGMLHASCLARNDQALLLMAPHNSGKSTTALHLALAGWRLLSDSMLFVLPESGQLAGFPVGKVKLRQDMIAEFPRLGPLLASEAVREETKFSLDLRQLDESLVQTTAISPAAILLCLLERHDHSGTILQPATEAELWAAVMRNSLYYDTEMVWRRNLAQLERLLSRARAFRLVIGTDTQGVINTINGLA